jgi:hypothetical protein
MFALVQASRIGTGSTCVADRAWHASSSSGQIACRAVSHMPAPSQVSIDKLPVMQRHACPRLRRSARASPRASMAQTAPGMPHRSAWPRGCSALWPCPSLRGRSCIAGRTLSSSARPRCVVYPASSAKRQCHVEAAARFGPALLCAEGTHVPMHAQHAPCLLGPGALCALLRPSVRTVQSDDAGQGGCQSCTAVYCVRHCNNSG